MLSHLFETRDEIIGDASAYARLLAGKLGLGSVGGGVPVNESTALNHSAVWAGLDFLSSTIGQLPCSTFTEQTLESSNVTNAISQSTPAGKLIKQRANPRMTAFRFKQLMQAHAVFYGNAYAWVERNQRFDPMALWPLPPNNTRLHMLDADTLVVETEVKGQREILSYDDVIHIPGFGLNGIVGLSFLEYMREAVGLGLSAQKFGSNFFAQGANPRIIATHPAELGEEATVRLRDQLNGVLGGVSNAFKVAVLEEGMQITALTIPPEQGQFLETRKDNRVEIAGAMRIPPQMIGIYDRATWSNSEQMDIFVVKYTLSSWLKRWEEELDAKLLTQRQRDRGLFHKFNVNALLRGDIKTRTEFYKAMMQGVMSPNEIRAKEDLNALPGLDEPYVPLNMVPASEASQVDDEPELILTGDDDDEAD